MHADLRRGTRTAKEAARWDPRGYGGARGYRAWGGEWGDAAWCSGSDRGEGDGGTLCQYTAQSACRKLMPQGSSRVQFVETVCRQRGADDAAQAAAAVGGMTTERRPSAGDERTAGTFVQVPWPELASLSDML